MHALPRRATCDCGVHHLLGGARLKQVFRMGNACAKPVSTHSEPLKETNGDDSNEPTSMPMEGASHDSKAKTFRERRLSVAQKPATDAARRIRRLSVYGGVGGPQSDPSTPIPPVPACGAQSIAGLEPVPGGAVKKINQDRAVARYPFAGDKASFLGGVFDGHGRAGEKVSQYVIDTLPDELAAHPSFKADPGEALRLTFMSVDTSLADHVDASVSGTTAVACLIRGNHMWLANSGDSRAVMCRQKANTNKLIAHDLTVDQKPDTPAEMKRILARGGHVTPAGANGSPSRVWHNLRGLAMARSIGDHAAATVGVIAEPEVTEYDIMDDDVCLIIASDGVWELLSSQQVADVVADVQDLDPMTICNNIVEKVRMSVPRTPSACTRTCPCSRGRHASLPAHVSALTAGCHHPLAGVARVEDGGRRLS